MPSPHPLLSGIYEPVADERDDASLEVTGALPAALRGTFLIDTDGTIRDAVRADLRVQPHEDLIRKAIELRKSGG